MENLLKISLSISIIGILLLLFLSNYLSYPETDLRSINKKMLNQKVKVQGTTFMIENKENFQIISIVDETGKINVICESNITGIQKIQVQGTVREYNGDLQIQADKIIKNKK